MNHLRAGTTTLFRSSNITIRTLFNEEDRLHCWAGGGLVDDSQADAEYQEQLDKVGAFLHALENFRPTQR